MDRLVLTLSSSQSLVINNNMAMKEIYGQLQKYCNEILAIINDLTVIAYQPGQLPLPGLIFLPGRSDLNKKEYYFRDNNSNRYLIFGKNNAQLFYGKKMLTAKKINKLGPIIEVIRESDQSDKDCREKITLVDGPNIVKLSFYRETEEELEISCRTIF